MDTTTILLFVFAIVIGFLPLIFSRKYFLIKGLPTRKDHKHVTSRVAFTEYKLDVEKTKHKLDIVCGDIDCNVYDIFDTIDVSLNDKLKNKLSEGIEINVYAGPSITIKDTFKVNNNASNNNDQSLSNSSENDIAKASEEDIAKSSEEDLKKASGFLKLVIDGVGITDAAHNNKINLYYLNEGIPRHFRIRDYGHDDESLYVESYHPPMECVRSYFTISNSHFFIHKYQKKLEEYKNNNKIVKCETLEEIKNKFKLVPRKKHSKIKSKLNSEEK